MERKNDTMYSVVLIGGSWKEHWLRGVLNAVYAERVSEISRDSPKADIILLGTGVDWDENGMYSLDRLKREVVELQERGYLHEVFLTSIMPLGVCEELSCHYLPISPFSKQNPIFGLNLSLPFDIVMLKTFFRSLFSQKVRMFNVQDAEIMSLIEICQNWISISFYQEMSLFCELHHIRFMSSPNSFYPNRDMKQIMVYMIRNMEEQNIDCPLLYSCLFRHNYINNSLSK